MLHGIHSVRLCKGVTFQQNLPRTFVKETFSEMHSQKSIEIARSKSCKKFLPFSGNTYTCKTCTDTFNQHSRRVSKIKTDENRNICGRISSFGHRGKILIDEMTVQDDLVITKKGDKLDIVGMVDMGSTNDFIKVITDGQKKVEMATHALQFIFHGYTGFR